MCLELSCGAEQADGRVCPCERQLGGELFSAGVHLPLCLARIVAENLVRSSETRDCAGPSISLALMRGQSMVTSSLAVGGSRETIADAMVVAKLLQG